MKVKIIDSLGGQWRCDSRDPDLIGRWLIERATRLAADDGGMAPMYLYVWPEDQQEKDDLGWRGGMMVSPARLAEVMRGLA